MKANRNFQCDRKDIVMTGHGRIKMIHLLLLDTVENYTRQYEREVHELIIDCRKNYSSGVIKAYTISDQLAAHRLIYITKSHQVKAFP